MRRVPTTVVALVGARAHAAVGDLRDAANVRAVAPEPHDPPLVRAVAAWREAARTHRTYLAHDADPLDAVARAWTAFYDRTGVRGDLEVAVSDALARWRAGSIELPDYYIVLDPDEMPTTRRHWFLGYLHERAPARVVPVRARRAEIRATLGRLRAGRWWPDLDDLLAALERSVPDRVGTPAESTVDTEGADLVT